jgi:transcriptional regulator with XRE-family HTH domain
MGLNIGNKIAELRKAKGMTQEQLALALGISAPAVSKWETDNSYPDITLLCPLARALDTNVDTLLEYEEVLSEEKIQAYINEIIEIGRNQDVLLANKKLQKLLCQYPNSVSLKFHAVSLLTTFQVMHPECSEAKRNEWEIQKTNLLEEIYESKNPTYMNHSISALAALAIQNNKLDKAEKLLEQLPENIGDITHYWVQIYLKRGNKDKALELLQKRMFSLAHQILSCLSLMIEKVHTDNDKALELCAIYQKIEKVFEINGKSSELVYALTYNRAGRENEATSSIIHYLESWIKNEMPVPNPILFSPTIKFKQEMSGNMVSKEMILRSLEADETFSKICENEEVKRLIEKLITKE